MDHRLNKVNLKRVAKWVGAGAVLALAGLFGFGCSMLPDFGGKPPVDVPVARNEDLGTKALEALPEVADAASNLLQTFVVTAVIVALVFPAARVAAVGVFVAFYSRISSWFAPKNDA